MLLLASLGGVVSLLYAAMGVMGHGAHLLVPVVLVVLVLVGRPLLILWAVTSLGADRTDGTDRTDLITVRRPPLGEIAIPYSRVGLVGTRRGLVLEWPVLYLRDGSVAELGAPVRFWFRADPVFDRDLGALRALAGRPQVAGLPPRWSMLRLLAGPLAAVAALSLVLIDPPWASDSWPLRVHAQRLPDACRILDTRARRLLPGATVDRAVSRSDDSDAYVKRHTCEWDATHTAPDRTTVIDTGRLSIVLELDHGVGPVSDAAEAHREFRRQTHLGPGESEERIPRTGDEAELIIEPREADRTWVTVAVRRANVEEKIDLIYQGRAREREAAVTAEGFARLGLSTIRFR